MATQAAFQHPSFWTSWLVSQVQAANNLYTILVSSTVNVETQSVADIIANELPSANGYARDQVDVASLAGTYNSTNNYTNWTTLESQFSASGSDLTFRTAVLLIGANGTVGNTTGSILAVSQYATNQTISAGASTPFTVIWYPQWAMGTYNSAGTNPTF